MKNTEVLETIRQKRWGHRISFEFYADSVMYCWETDSMTQRFKFTYEEVPFDELSFWEDRNISHHSLSVGCLIMGVFASLLSFLNIIALAIGAVLVGFAYLFRYLFRTNTLIRLYFQANEGRVFIIKNKTFDTVMDAINRHRKQYYLDKYATIDPENSAENELRKFRWLADHGIMTKEEAQAKIDLIRSFDAAEEGAGQSS